MKNVEEKTLSDFLNTGTLKEAFEFIDNADKDLLTDKKACRHLCALLYAHANQAPEAGPMHNAISKQEIMVQDIVWQEECYELGKKVYRMIFHFHGSNSLIAASALKLWEPYLQNQVANRHIPNEELESLYAIVTGISKEQIADAYHRRWKKHLEKPPL